jgi:hypothetical protein
MVATRERDWIEAVGYVGPDRRRFNAADYSGPLKRRNDAASRATPAGEKEQAMRILASSLKQFDVDPPQALRSIREQTATLKRLAIQTADARLAVAVAALEMAVMAPSPNRASLSDSAAEILALAPAATFPD